MFFIISDCIMIIFSLVVLGFMFFVFDEAILKGYFATKLRKRFDVESLK